MQFTYLSGMEITTYKQVKEFLYTRRARKLKLGLENIQKLLELLDYPQNNFSSIQITGTNGKGSTVAILESILREAGYRSGRLTSPHLVNMMERIQFKGNFITEEEVIDILNRIKTLILATGASFFEIITAMAYIFFTQKKCDIAVLETGLGGRLDATSTSDPILTVITDIGFDHTKTLGKTLKSIAYEKAGIWKSAAPCVCGVKSSRVRGYLREFSKEKKVPIQFTADAVKMSDVSVTSEGTTFNARTLQSEYNNLYLNLLGEHQMHNAGVALLTVDELRKQGWNISKEAVHTGLSNIDWPGRLQIVGRSPLQLIDAAHNLMGFKSLVKALELFDYDNLIFVFGVLRDKEYRAMLNMVAPLAEKIILTYPGIARAVEPETIAAFPETREWNLEIERNINKAWMRAVDYADPGDLVCAAGSIYFIGDILKEWYKHD
ncbi:MAG: folylpolyglutamate synthase/dihydrofolate synthase family protein [bacterium]